MPIEVREKFDSRRLTKGQNPSAELSFIVLGTDDAITAGTPWRMSPTPPSRVWPAKECVDRTSRAGVVGRHGAAHGQNQGSAQPGTEAVFSFDTGGGTQHITQSLDTVHRYPAPGVRLVRPDFKGA